MGIDQASFWANLFLYTYEMNTCLNLFQMIKLKLAIFTQLNVLLMMGVYSMMLTKTSAPPKLKLKVEHSGTHSYTLVRMLLS